MPPCFRIVIVLSYYLLTVATQAAAQPYENRNCAKVSKEAFRWGPLTREEKIGVVSTDLSTELSRFEKCQNETVEYVDTENRKQSKSNDLKKSPENIATARTTSPAEQEKSNSSKSNLGKSTLSSNLIRPGEKSVAFTNEGKQISDPAEINFEANSEFPNLEAPPLISGKKHEMLEKSDNISILKEQIKARAEQENDPGVKAALLRRYEEL